MATKRTDGLRSVQISEVVDKGLEAWCNRRDRIKRATVTRILEQFLASPEVVQEAFLGEITTGLDSAYADALEELAKQIRKPRPVAAPAPEPLAPGVYLKPPRRGKPKHSPGNGTRPPTSPAASGAS